MNPQYPADYVHTNPNRMLVVAAVEGGGTTELASFSKRQGCRGDRCARRRDPDGDAQQRLEL